MNRVIFAALAITLAACSNASLPSATAPSAVAPSVTTSVSSGNAVASVRGLDPMQPSCPSQPPSGLIVMTNEGGGAEAQWNAVPNAEDYVLEITRREATNNYVVVDGFPVAEEHVARAFVLREEGRYQARVRTRACGAYGDWSAVFEFSTGVSQVPEPKQCWEDERCYID